MFRSIICLSAFIMLAILGACSAKKSGPTPPPANFVNNIQQQKNPNPQGLSTQLTLSKAAVLGRSYLYGATLQFSSMTDPKLATSLMGLSLGENLASFQIVDDQLQLIQDQSSNYESDVDHPGRLIHSFKIVQQDDASITVLAAEASPVLATMLFDDKVGPNRSSWIRSLEFVPENNLLMWESSIESADGSIGEFMETLVPRDNVVPKDYQPIYDDENLESAAERYRFLGTGPVYLNLPKGRTKTSLAQRWNLGSAGIVQWWVTNNVPDKYLPDLKNAVEAWNRYSQSMWNRDFVHFSGKLPAGVKVGDPRYNVIVWDTVQNAGAAYESQNSDPLTGIQTHSLIYMPYAWITIGKKYWQTAQFSDEDASNQAKSVKSYLQSRKFLGHALPVNCVEDPTMKITAQSRLNPDNFARGLLKTTTFHEVGHSFGLAHNFKGSLAFDPSQKDSIFSTSIMDYNEYDEEVSGAFTSLESAQGPLLEYDRQIISVLYNGAKDVKDSDPKLPACADEESDTRDGGVDPLCVRYDIGKDPSQVALNMIDLLQNPQASFANEKSLALALDEVGKSLPDAATVNTVSDANMAIGKYALTVEGVVNLYLNTGAGSIMSSARDIVRNLYVFLPNSLPDSSYDEKGMRDRALQALKFVVSFEKLPDYLQQKIAGLVIGAHDWLLTTPAARGIQAADKDKTLAQILQPASGLEADIDLNLTSRLRRNVLSTLTFNDTAPFYLHTDSSGTQDYESLAVGYLEQVLSTQANGADRPMLELTMEAKALATFAVTDEGEAAIGRVKAKWSDAIKKATDSQIRENLRQLQKALGASDSDDDT